MVLKALRKYLNKDFLFFALLPEFQGVGALNLTAFGQEVVTPPNFTAKINNPPYKFTQCKTMANKFSFCRIIMGLQFTNILLD